MSEQLPESRPPSRKRWGRRLLLVALVGVILIGALVLIAPTLLSMGVSRNFLNNQISNLATPGGRVEAGSYSLGWFSGQSIERVQIFDKQNEPVLFLDAKTDATLWDLARGKYDLGNTVIDLNINRLRIKEDKTTNFDEIFIQNDEKSGKIEENEPSKSGQPLAVPDFSGLITLKTQATIEIEKPEGREMVQLLDGSVISLDASNPESSIDIDAKLKYRIDEIESDSSFTAKLDVIENNVLLTDPAKITATGTARLDQLDLAIVRAALAVAGVNDLPLDASGKVDGGLDFAWKDSQGDLNLTLQSEALRVVQSDKPVLNDEPIVVDIGASIHTPGDSVLARLNRCKIQIAGEKVRVRLLDEQPLSLAISPELKVATKSGIRIDGDLAWLQSRLPIDVPEESRITGGKIDGALWIEPGERFDIRSDFTAMNLNQGQTLRNETVRVGTRSLINRDITDAQTWVSVASDFGSVDLSQLRLDLSKTDDAFFGFKNVIVDAKLHDAPKALNLIRAYAPGLAEQIQLKQAQAYVWSQVERETDSIKTITSIQLPQGISFVGREGAFDDRKPVKIDLTAQSSIKDLSLDAIDVQKLEVNAFDGAIAVRAPNPIRLMNLQSDAPQAQGRINVDASLDFLRRLEAAFVNVDESAIPFTGKLGMSQTFSVEGDQIVLTGNGRASNLKPVDPNASKLPINIADVFNTLAIDVKNQSIDVRELKLVAPERPQAATIVVQGNLSDWAGSQTLSNTKIEMIYDWAELWALVQPILDPAKMLTPITGSDQSTFVLEGDLANLTTLKGHGTLTFASVGYGGFVSQGAPKIEVPILIRNGQVLFAYNDGSKDGKPVEPIPLNGGVLNLAGVVFDLNEMALYAPRRHRLIADASLNAVVANQLGKYASVLFSNASKATGTLNVSLDNVRGLSVAELEKVGQNNSSGRIVYSISNLNLDGLVPQLIGQALDTGTGGIQGQVNNAVVELKNGQVMVDFSLDLLRRETAGDVQLPMTISGSVDLNTFALRDMKLGVPSAMIKSRELQKFVGATFTVPIGGTVDSPQLNLAGAVQEELRKNLLKPENLLDRILK